MNSSPGISNKISLLNSLLLHAEELLFAFALPEDTVRRYESLKNEVYSEIGISRASNIWKMQREAYSKSLTNKKEATTQINMYLEVEKIHKLKLSEIEQKIEGVKWESIQKVQRSHQVTGEFYNLSVLMLGFIDNCSKSISNLAGIYFDNKNSQCHLEEENSFSLSYEDDYENILTAFKALQNSDCEKLVYVKNEFKLKENSFNNLFELIENEICLKDNKLSEYEARLIEEDNKNSIEIMSLKSKLKSYDELLKQKGEECTKQINLELEIARNENKKHEDNLNKAHKVQLEQFAEEKDHIYKRHRQALEDQEKAQDHFINVLNNLKIELQEAVSDKHLLENQLEKFNSHINDLNQEITNSHGMLSKERKNSEMLQAENHRLKSMINQDQEQYSFDCNSIEKSYKLLLERTTFDSQETIKSLEDKIYYLQNELEKKNHDLSMAFLNIESTDNEKSEFFQLISEKDRENENLRSKCVNLAEEISFLDRDTQALKDQIRNIQNVSKKYYLELKSKPNTNVDDYFSEMVSCISQLLIDKEWLIRKIEELTNSSELKKKSKAMPAADISKSSTSAEFYASSINSFKVLKFFEKSRSDLINKFNS